MVDPVELLSLLAELSVALAGFSGVVVAFGAKDSWREDDHFRVTALLAYSLGPLGYALLALSLLAADVAPSTVWTISGAALGVCILGVLCYFISTAGRLAENPNMRVTKRMGNFLQVMSAAAVLLLVANTFFLHAFWPSFAAAASQLLWGGIVFGRLLLLR